MSIGLLRARWPILPLCLLVLVAIPVQVHLAELDLGSDSEVLLENNGDLDGQYVLSLLTLLDMVEQPLVPAPVQVLHEAPSIVVSVGPLVVPDRADARAPPPSAV